MLLHASEWNRSTCNIVAKPYYYWWTPHIPHQVIPHLHIYHLKMFYYQLCSTRYTAVWINNCLKRISAIKEATMKITDDFHMSTTKSTLFMENKDKWDTKEGPGKSMKNALYVQLHGKGTSWVEATSNSKKSSPYIVLAIVELCESESIR